MIQNILDDIGMHLPVMEYFISLQGEGFHTGLASFFIRIGGCDVGCHWCDVKESWNPELHPLINVDEVLDKIPSQIKTVVITGGEPSLYNLLILPKGSKKEIKISIWKPPEPEIIRTFRLDLLITQKKRIAQ